MTPIDLHTHSTYSDGLLTPEALCAMALRKRVRVISLCDHDTTDGLAPMGEAVERLNRGGAELSLIPSVELSTGSTGRTHILGYGIRPESAPLQDAIAALRQDRAARGRRMVEALAAMGISIPKRCCPTRMTRACPSGGRTWRGRWSAWGLCAR